MPGALLVAGHAATASRVAASPALLAFGGIGSELIVLVSEIVLTVLLYVLLKPVNQTLSLLAAAARLAMTVIHGLNLLNYFLVLQIAGGAGSQSLAVFSVAQLQALVLLFLKAHHFTPALGRRRLQAWPSPEQAILCEAAIFIS